jgi:hypothetical protein
VFFFRRVCQFLASELIPVGFAGEIPAINAEDEDTVRLRAISCLSQWFRISACRSPAYQERYECGIRNLLARAVARTGEPGRPLRQWASGERMKQDVPQGNGLVKMTGGHLMNLANEVCDSYAESRGHGSGISGLSNLDRVLLSKLAITNFKDR